MGWDFQLRIVACVWVLVAWVRVWVQRFCWWCAIAAKSLPQGLRLGRETLQSWKVGGRANMRKSVSPPFCIGMHNTGRAGGLLEGQLQRSREFEEKLRGESAKRRKLAI